MTEVFAHRGAHRIERENTLGAFRIANDLGVDGVELDVRRTADGTLVIHHDPTIDGRAIALADASELPPYVAHFDEAMVVMGGLCVNVEIKNARDPREPTYDDTGTIEREVVEYVHAEGLTSTATISCFDLATCDRVRALAPDLYVAWLIRGRSLVDALAVAHEHEFNAVNPHYSMVDPVGAQRAGELGLDLNVWTVNQASELLAMAALGVKSVITDEPELALDLLRDA
ncbi:MAG TPA: glycerophosphodiester phosphodiesterase [Acidimicrobiales bacterium]|jgi:glycerophosphoryl diester phosphodiesterase|nr:glycerophosphodiester phosphodiesterase [Acidimicrobiales bacterium]